MPYCPLGGKEAFGHSGSRACLLAGLPDFGHSGRLFFDELFVEQAVLPLMFEFPEVCRKSSDKDGGF